MRGSAVALNIITGVMRSWARGCRLTTIATDVETSSTLRSSHAAAAHHVDSRLPPPASHMTLTGFNAASELVWISDVGQSAVLCCTSVRHKAVWIHAFTLFSLKIWPRQSKSHSTNQVSSDQATFSNPLLSNFGESLRIAASSFLCLADRCGIQCGLLLL